MSRGRWMAAAILITIAALLALNAIGLDNQTEAAEVTVEGAEVMQLTGGSLQVLDTTPEAGERERGIPVVLIHCYTCSLRWWDRMAPLLSERHRVVRLDLLGHGGSEKPAQGYDVDAQADLVAEALGRLGVEGALVVGHSLGGSVATALAQRHSELTDRIGLIGVGADSGQSDLPFTSKLSRTAVLGHALWRLIPRSVWRSGTDVAFAHGFDKATGFDDGEQPVEDLRSMTYRAYQAWPDANDEWGRRLSLARRLASANVPALVILGAADQIVDSAAAAQAFAETVPAARVRVLDAVGHSPNVEAPEETAALLEGFAAEAEVRAGRSQPRNRRGPG